MLANITTHRNRGNGEIQLVLGPMFSGKTTELMRRVHRLQIAKFNCVIIKYAPDTRYSNLEVASHDKHTSPAISGTKLFDLRDAVQDYEVIAIDEGQFFLDIVEFSEHMANKGKIVIVCGLDGTFQRQPFNRILELVPLAESVQKLAAICSVCNADAAFTFRMSEEKTVEVIGGSDKYVALCRQCYQRFDNKNVQCSPVKEQLYQQMSKTLQSSPRKFGDHCN